MRALPPKLLWFLVLTPTLFGFDFFTKEAVVSSLGPQDMIQVIPSWFAIVHAQNPNIAFSIPVPHALIYTAGVLMLGMVLHTLWTLEARDRVTASALALIASGGLGNAVDRMRDGSVTDFLYVYTDHPTLTPWLREHVGMTAWPVFNVADIALVAGVLLFLVHQTFWPQDDSDTPTPTPT